jgi:transcriptional regulator
MLSFVSERAFATLVASSTGGRIVVAQAPVLVDGDRLLLHLSRKNPLAGTLPLCATAIVHGPDAYVSPDWYGQPDQVPTWSYVSVELEGQLVANDGLVDILRRMSARFEAALDKPAWTPDKVSPARLDAMLSAIVGVTMTLDDVRGTRKLSQNKPPEARAGVAAALDTSAHAMDRDVAAWMRSVVG